MIPILVRRLGGAAPVRAASDALAVAAAAAACTSSSSSIGSGSSRFSVSASTLAGSSSGAAFPSTRSAGGGAAGGCSTSGQQQRRGIATSRAAADLREFVDPDTTEEQVTYGRPWMAHELRLKSWADLHGLWYVCLKERNLVATQLAWRKGGVDEEAYKDRYRKVKKTMNRIKQVLSERACQEVNPVRRAQMKKAIHLM